MRSENSKGVPAAGSPGIQAAAFGVRRTAIYILQLAIVALLAVLIVYLQSRSAMLVTAALWRAFSICSGIVTLR